MAASAVALIALTLLTVLVRNPATHGNINGPDFSERVTHSHLGEVTPMVSPGLNAAAAMPTGDRVADGARLFFGFGCASCHGLDGVTGVVGGDTSDPVEEGLDEFISEVRRGPEGMPSFGEDAFTDDELASIHAYLESRLTG